MTEQRGTLAVTPARRRDAGAGADADAEPQRGGARPSAWSVLRRDRVALVAMVFLGLLTMATVLSPLLPGLDATRVSVQNRLQPPTWEHPFGTDQLGRDMLSRVAEGAWISLVVALGSVAFAATTGVLMGLLSGYSGGVVDEAIMRSMDLLMAFPAILLALTIVAVLGHSTINVILALGIVYAPRFARVARASVLAAKAELYVEAARAIGAADGRILLRYLLPNVFSPLLVAATVTLANSVLAEASLSFLGLGVQPPYPSWGRMLSEGKGYLEMAPWLTVFPGIAIAMTVLTFNLLGDSLEDALDPKLRFEGKGDRR